jgi:hypothetical protein
MRADGLLQQEIAKDETDAPGESLEQSLITGAACLQFGHSKSPYSTSVTAECAGPMA